MYTNIPLSKNWYNGHHKKQTIAIYSKSKQKKPCVRLKKYLYIYSRSLKIFLYSQACLGQLTVDVTYLCSYGLLCKTQVRSMVSLSSKKILVLLSL